MDFARADAVEAFLHLHVYRELQETGVCGATVCLSKVGRYTFTLANCYGFQDSTRGLILDTRSSLFDLGGCAKVLAAMALLRLLQEKGLTVAADVNSVLPAGLQVDTSRYGGVTVQHLLTHTSGLQRGDRGARRAVAAGEGAEGTPGEAAPSAPPPLSPRLPAAPSGAESKGPRAGAADGTATPVMSYLMAQEVYGAKPPGVYRAHDIDYMLIGAIVEGLAGQQYESYVKEKLLEPLGVHLPSQPPGPVAWREAGAAPADADEAQEGSSVYVYVRPEAPRALVEGAEAAGGACAKSSSLEEALAADELGPTTAPDKRVLLRCNPPPLTPVGGLVLVPTDIIRLLALFIQSPSSSADDEAAQAASGRNLLATLYEIRLSDFIKDIGVAYGGLVSLGLAHCGDRVVTCESPPAPPSTRERVLSAQGTQGEAAQQQRPSATGAGGGGGDASPGHPSLLLLAPESGFAMVVSCNTAGPEGAAFCRNVAAKLLEQYRPSELPRPVARSWLAAVPPPRQDAMVHLIAFPPACCVAPATFFDAWPLLLPDYIKVHCMQAPGHGSRRSETCELRLSKLVAPAAAAILASVATDAPLALFGHGLGALWAFEVARRLECLYQRQVLHLFVCACASPSCFLTRGSGGTEASGGGGGEGGAARSAPSKRFEPWRTKDQPVDSEAQGGAPDLYELPDEAFISACRNHPRCPPKIRSHEHMPLFRADIEAEMKYTFVPPAPTLCASVAAALASVQNRVDEEVRISQGLLSCPITVLTPEEEVALGTDQTAGWEQVTTGQVRFQTVPGDYHCLEDRKHRSQVVACVTGVLGRQMSVHVPWLAKMRPAGMGGRWAGGGSGKHSGNSRPGSAAGPALTLHLPPMYPRG